MYKIYADDTLIYDSTIEDYKIVKGSISLETNKSGSFSFSIYPDHFYYDKFIRLKTVITVYKSGRIVFRGRILNDVTDYWNNKVLTCEGELGFLQDSIIRPFTFVGTPEKLFTKFIEEHNAQVDEFKRVKIGTVTVEDPNNYIARSNSDYESAFSNLNSRLIEDSLGGYFYITHGEDGTDIIPTINYLADFTKVSTQKIEFGSNLKNYTKTVKAEEIATVIIPLGHEVDDGDDNTENPKLTIKSVNGGKDYVYSEEGVALYGWICKVVSWDDVTDASNLKSKAEAYLENVINQNVTIELNAIDLHLLDKSIESFGVGNYIHVISKPHNFDSVLLCNKQTIDLLKPENDTVTLGYTYSTFTEVNNRINYSVSNISTIRKKATNAESIAKGNVVTITNIKNEIEQTLTDFDKDMLLKIYPVGSIYMSVNDTSPADIFGGTWERIKDVFLLSAGDKYANGATGGESEHTLTVAEMPKHRHEGIEYSSTGLKLTLNTGSSGYRMEWTGPNAGSGNDELKTTYTGGGLAHNNMPPYFTVYMWKRIA